MANLSDVSGNLSATAKDIAENTNLIGNIPDGWVVLGGVAIFFLVYYFLPKDMQTPIKKGVKQYAFYIIVFLCWLYFRKRWGLVYENPAKWPADIYLASFRAGLVIAIWNATKWLMYQQRYFTRQFVSNNVSGSINRYQEIGDWIVFFVGTTGSSTEKIVIPFPIPQKLVVVPKCACAFLGEHVVCQSQVMKTDLQDLDEEIIHFIETDTFAKLKKSEVYFGLWDEKLKMRNPLYVEIAEKYNKACARRDELAKMLKGKLKDVKGFISDTMGMQDKLKGTTPWSKAKSDEVVE